MEWKWKVNWMVTIVSLLILYQILGFKMLTPWKLTMNSLVVFSTTMISLVYFVFWWNVDPTPKELKEKYGYLY